MPAGVVPVQLMRWLRENKEEKWKLNDKERGYMVAEWVEREKGNRAVGAEIHVLRKRGEGLWCSVDYGWGADASGKSG